MLPVLCPALYLRSECGADNLSLGFQENGKLFHYTLAVATHVLEVQDAHTPMKNCTYKPPKSSK